MTGWQLSTFKESYNYKLKEGVSLFKKKLLEKRFKDLFSLSPYHSDETSRLDLKVLFPAKIKIETIMQTQHAAKFILAICIEPK